MLLLILYFGVGLIGIIFLYFLYCHINERMHPFKYTGVYLYELDEHIEQLYRRGFSKSTLVIQHENESNAHIEIRKSWPFGEWAGEEAISLELVINEKQSADIKNQLKKAIQISGQPDKCRWTIRKDNGRWIYKAQAVSNILLHRVLAAITRKLFIEMFHLNKDSLFEIWVKGPISPYDELICPNTRILSSLGTHSNDIPYKWWQAEPSRAKQLGRITGNLLQILIAPFRRKP